MRPGHNVSTDLSFVMRHSSQETVRGHASGSIRYLVHRRLVCIAFVLVGLIGAPGIASAAPPVVEAEDTGGSGGAISAETQNQYVAARLFNEVFSQQKPDVCVLLMSANAINHTPAGDFVGPAGFERYVAELWTAYPASAASSAVSVASTECVEPTGITTGQPVAGSVMIATSISKMSRSTSGVSTSCGVPMATTLPSFIATIASE